MKLHKFLELSERQPWIVWVVTNEWIQDFGKLEPPNLIEGWTFTPNSLGRIFREIIFRVGMIKYIAFRPVRKLDWSQTFKMVSAEQNEDSSKAYAEKRIQFHIYWHLTFEESFSQCFKIDGQENSATTIQQAVDNLRKNKNFYLDAVIRITTEVQDAVQNPPCFPVSLDQDSAHSYLRDYVNSLVDGDYQDSYDIYPVFEMYDDYQGICKNDE